MKGIPASEMERINKLRTLAKRGATEGERAAAKAACDRIMAKYGYRPKAKPEKAEPAPKPAPERAQDPPPQSIEDIDLSQASMEELAAAVRAMGVSLNDVLADMFSAYADMFTQAAQEARQAADDARQAADGMRDASGGGE